MSASGHLYLYLCPESLFTKWERLKPTVYKVTAWSILSEKAGVSTAGSVRATGQVP